MVDNTPTLITPVLGVATATSINKMAITAPATSSTLAVADGKTFTASKTLTLTGTDSTTMTFPTTSATIARTDAAQTFTGAQTFSSTISGATTVGVGAATPSASGAGITFPATQSASTDANTLDDYEEGDWTPNVGGSATYTLQKGRYVKVGSVVTVNCDIWVNVIGTGSTQYVSGLPFASNNGTNAATTAGSIGYFAGINSNVYFMTVINAPGNSYVQFETLTGASSAMNDGVAIFKDGCRVIFTMTYLTA